MTDYLAVVKTPMDFSTMQRKLEGGHYLAFDTFAADFDLICANCMAYNRPETVYHKQAERLRDAGHKLIEAAQAKWEGASLGCWGGGGDTTHP